MKNRVSYFWRALLIPAILMLTLLTTGCASTAKPGVSDHVITVWSNEALIATLNYDYANYHKQFQAASQYFTPQGWKNYMTAFNESGNLKTVIRKRMVVSAVAQATPSIISEGVDVNGRYSWRLQAPMLITYEGPAVNKQQSVVVDLLVVRADGQLGVRGLAVDQLVMHEAPDAISQDWRSK